MTKRFAGLWVLFLCVFVLCTEKKDARKSENEAEMEERFYYEVGRSAPMLRPGEYISVDFIGESGAFGGFGNESTHGGMAMDYGGVSGDETRNCKLPKAAEATWVSYTDWKVYCFSSLPPYDTILALFRDGGAPCESLRHLGSVAHREIRKQIT